MATLENLDSMKVNDLKQELTARGLPVVGRKADLVKRLSEALAKDATPAVVEQPVVASSSEPEKPEKPATGEANGTATKQPIESNPPAKADTEKKSATLQAIEQLKQRAERFGLNKTETEDDKKKARAQRFGLMHPELEEDKKKARAQRFGLFHPEVEAERKKARAERFGLHHPELEAEKKKARAARFGLFDESLEKDKKALRAARFGPILSDADADAEKKRKRAERFGAISFDDQKKARADKFKPLG